MHLLTLNPLPVRMFISIRLDSRDNEAGCLNWYDFFPGLSNIGERRIVPSDYSGLQVVVAFNVAARNNSVSWLNTEACEREV